MEEQYRINCKICNHDLSTKRFSITRHMKKHNISFDDYISKYYKLINSQYDKCGFCDRIAKPEYTINHENMTYSLYYPNGYFCGEDICKHKISLDILGIEYDSKKYERIGSKSEYLSKLYKINLKEAKEMKYKEAKVKFRCSLEEFQIKYGEKEGKIRYDKRINGITKNNPRNKFPCTLDNFINRYGIKIGTDKYNKRCEKISYTSSIDFFIEKYGEEKGLVVWKNKFKNEKISKTSKVLNNILEELNINYIPEKCIDGKFVDFYIEEYNMVIEFFGDYWHANPKKYNKDYYNSRNKRFAKDIWDFDKKRLEFIHNKVDTIIVVWEGSKVDISILEKTINDFKNKKTIIYL